MLVLQYCFSPGFSEKFPQTYSRLNRRSLLPSPSSSSTTRLPPIDLFIHVVPLSLKISLGHYLLIVLMAYLLLEATIWIHRRVNKAIIWAKLAFAGLMCGCIGGGVPWRTHSKANWLNGGERRASGSLSTVSLYYCTIWRPSAGWQQNRWAPSVSLATDCLTFYTFCLNVPLCRTLPSVFFFSSVLTSTQPGNLKLVQQFY